MNKETYLLKIRNINAAIEVEKKILSQTRNKISNLEDDLQRHIQSCNHKYDDGTTAWKDSYYWHSEPSQWYNDFTGEMEDHDDGYQVRQTTCQICGRED